MSASTLRLKTGEVVEDRRRDPFGVSQGLLQSVLVQVEGGLPLRAGGKSAIIQAEVECHEIVGDAYCLPVKPGDQYVLARRPGKIWQTRFVVNRDPEPTARVTVILGKNGDSIALLASYFGTRALPEPEDTKALDRELDPVRARENAAKFWLHHVLVLGADDVICNECGRQIPRNKARDVFRSFSEIYCYEC